MNKKVAINKIITKHTIVANIFRPSKNKLYGTQKNNSEFIGSLKKSKKKRYAQAFD